MKTFLRSLFLTLAILVPAYLTIKLPPPMIGQVNTPQIRYTANAPSGACGATQIALLTPDGTLYTCANGTWAAVNGGSAGTCGALAGDVTGTCAASIVGKTNGLQLPLSSAFLSTNSSRQVINGTPWTVFSITTNTTATTATFNNRSVYVTPSGSFSFTLVAVASQPAFGQYVSGINFGTGSITIARDGQQINGSNSAFVVPAAPDAQHPTFWYVISDGSNYFAYVGGSPVTVPSFTALTDGATVTWAVANALNANATLLFTTNGGSRTLNLTGLVNGGNYVLRATQDGSGTGEGLTLGTGCTWKVINGGAGAITPSTAANAMDVLAFGYDGTNCLATFGKNYN